MGSGRPRSKVLLRQPSGGAAARLFCFPYSGLGASMFTRWPARIGDIEVCLVQPPGRENRIRDPHFGTYEELAVEVVEGLGPHLDRPFAFVGHCGGALAAIATAVALAAADGPAPDCVFVSSQVAPQDGPFGRFLQMSDDELTVEMTELTRAMGGEPQPEIVALGVRVLRADITANQRYRTEDPVVLPGRLHAIGWSDDPEIRPEQMTGWSACAAAERFRQVVLPGGHHDFLHAPDVLLDELAHGMRRARTILATTPGDPA